MLLGKPLIAVNHINGHIAGNYITYKDLTPPFLCLVISGGHTNLVNVTDYNVSETLGKTRDDAIGEAFDKVARVVGLRISSVDLKLINWQKREKKILICQ